uniref:Uncharacterized protein n=1 Tax=Pelusios castaneus TaxID=367368 RepID=A0A8C8R518_9SAUR
GLLISLLEKRGNRAWPSPFDPTANFIVNVIHSATGYHSKTIRFLNVAFDSSGDTLLAGDHQGNIYVFDLIGNR